jgi:bilirubin oxidase
VTFKMTFKSNFVHILVAGSLLSLQVYFGTCEEKVLAPRLSPYYSAAFDIPLTIPHIKQPIATYTNPETKVPIDFFEVEVKEVLKQFYPNLGNARIITYDGTFPGPSFRVQKGRESVVRVINKSMKSMNFHVHGSYSR